MMRLEGKKHSLKTIALLTRPVIMYEEKYPIFILGTGQLKTQFSQETKYVSIGFLVFSRSVLSLASEVTIFFQNKYNTDKDTDNF